MQREIVAAGAQDTEDIGAALARRAGPGIRIYLHGPLGVGKTTFVRGFLRGLGFTGKVKSPTFALVETYELPSFPVFHFDLYRLERPEELESIGFRDYFDGTGVCLVEWPEKAHALLMEPDLYVHLFMAIAGRLIRLEPRTDQGRSLLRGPRS